MLTKLEKEKIQNAMVKIEERIGEVAKELQDKRSVHSSAAETYGSELSAGAMEETETGIYNEIVTLGEQRELLRSVLSGEIDLSIGRSDDLSGEIGKISNNIEHLRKLLVPLYEETKKIHAAKAIISRYTT